MRENIERLQRVKYKLYFLFIFLSLAVVSCSSDANELTCINQLPMGLQSNANAVLKISIPDNMNTLKLGNLLTVVVETLSHEIVYVSPDDDLKFYLRNNNSWSLIENKVDFLSVVDQIVPKTDTDPGGMAFPASFDFSENRTSIHVCITVIGSESLGGPKGVSAYKEIILVP